MKALLNGQSSDLRFAAALRYRKLIVTHVLSLYGESLAV